MEIRCRIKFNPASRVNERGVAFSGESEREREGLDVNDINYSSQRWLAKGFPASRVGECVCVVSFGSLNLNFHTHSTLSNE